MQALRPFFAYLSIHYTTLGIQKEVFASADRNISKKEYKKLVRAALRKGKKRLAMIIQTLCSMGIRISELSSITVESIIKGIVEIYCKGKQRVVLFPKKLQKLLLKYIDENNIETGLVFCTSRGNAVDRSNVWREMKELSEEAEVKREKILIVRAEFSNMPLLYFQIYHNM